jgi:hypothetical protein
MKKTIIILMTLVFSVAYSADVVVTFRANSSTVQGVIDTADVTPGGAGLTGVDLRGEVQEYSTGTAWIAGADPMVSMGGDYWQLDVTFPEATIGLEKQYKFGFNTLNLDGTVSSAWEGTDNRILTVPSVNTVLDVEYVNAATPPFVDNTDSLDVYFRVNMSTNTDFDPATQQVHMAGSIEGWSHSIIMNREGDSDYYNYHWRGNSVADAPVAIEWKYTLGDWSGTEESNNRALTISQDTTIQWVYYNNVFPEPFAASDTLTSLTFSTDVASAIANTGFDQGDTLLVKWGYGGSQTGVNTDTLTSGLGTIYGVTVADVGVDLGVGMYYQYYRIKNAAEYRENYFTFGFTGDDQTLAERRYHDLSGAVAGAAFTITDVVNSTVDPRRMPLFRNADVIDSGAADTDSLEVTYFCDLRPAYYQVLSGDTLEDIQGEIDVSVADSVFAWGVAINGPATGGWTTWGGQLASDKMMMDDGVAPDVAAGDSVYTLAFKYQKNSATLGQEFKFGVRGGDNETGFGLNHIENIDPANPEVFSYFGSINPTLYSAWDYDTNEPSLGVENTGGALPSGFKLFNNFPNPFNPSTMIMFNIPIGVKVRLTVYNLLGAEIATIYNDYVQPGQYQVIWNGRDMQGNLVPSGTYLFELDSGSYFRQVKKMTLLK